MGKPCRLSFFAYRDQDASITYGAVGEAHFTEYDLINGITYCEWLIELGFVEEPHDNFSLHGFIKWANEIIADGNQPRDRRKATLSVRRGEKNKGE